MIRTQVQLTDEQAEAVHRLAAEQGVSVAAVIRQALDRHLQGGQAGARGRAIAAIGGFRSGRHDVSERHDEHLADAFDR